jgi:predicted nucleic acid-binding protein
MSARSFLDTNVLVYADDGDSPEKQKRAHRRHPRATRRRDRRALAPGAPGVLRHHNPQARDRFRRGAAQGRGALPVRCGCPDAGDLLAAIDLHRQHQVSIWDALIVRAAQRSACTVLLTEDLQDGRVFDGVEVVNPFRALTEPRER